MKNLKKALIIIPFFILMNVNGQYLKNYEPINIFLKTQKIDSSENCILQSDKADNKIALRIFNGSEGAVHLIDKTDSIDYTGGLFEEIAWKKMYNQYASDTLKKYWKKEDFPNYKFIFEKGTGLVLNQRFMEKYRDTRVENIIVISEPMYYSRKKYVMFYYNVVSFWGSNDPKVVIMKKEKEKWEVVKIIADYIYY